MRAFAKKDLPVSKIRRFLEPGPIVLVSSAWKGETNIMTMGWHMVMGFEPSLIGCYIWDRNHSFGMIKGSKECAINIPTFDIARQVVGIGNCSGADVDKFAKFKLTPVKGARSILRWSRSATPISSARSSTPAWSPSTAFSSWKSSKRR